MQNNQDGAVLTEGSGGAEFSANTANLSPILKLGADDVHLQNIEEEQSGDLDGTNKRKRDSFDNISLMSTDSLMMAPSGIFSSAKKPKLIRTGSITRGLRRSMSFVALKNPIANVLRSRRNSTIDPNASLTSITSVESHTFNESIKKPVAEKMRSLRNRIMKCNKRDITPKGLKSSISGNLISRKFRPILDNCDDDMSANVDAAERAAGLSDVPDFKTPLAPRPQSRFTQQLQPTSFLVDNGFETSTNANHEESNALATEKQFVEAERSEQCARDSGEDVEMRVDMDIPEEAFDTAVPEQMNEIAVDVLSVLSVFIFRQGHSVVFAER